MTKPLDPTRAPGATVPADAGEPTTVTPAVESGAPSAPPTPPLFTALGGVPFPDFAKQVRSVYPFDDLHADPTGAKKNHFCAGPDTKALKQRLYSAIGNRKKAHPDEDYRITLGTPLVADGNLYVWRVQ